MRGLRAILAVGILLTAAAGQGVALQKATPSPASDGLWNDVTVNRGNAYDAGLQRKVEELRLHHANAERQKTMSKEAALLLQMATELQLKVSKSEQVTSEEALRQVETIEKLAHNVKERMKGSR